MGSGPMEVLLACGSNSFSGVGMMLFNKLAVQKFPLECCLVWIQMLFSALCALLFFPYIRIGSVRDVLRWSLVVPFYSGLLLTSILALKNAPMTLVIVLRNISPLVALWVERFYPDPLRISGQMMLAMVMMICGALMYVSDMPSENWNGAAWVFLNCNLALADRLLQRLFLSKEQQPVDISMMGIAFINSVLGMVPIGLAAFIQGEFTELPVALSNLDVYGKFYVAMTCVVGFAICFTGLWAQSLISATSFMVMVNANKFIIISIEALSPQPISLVQRLGAGLSVVGSIFYGFARQQIEHEESERKMLLEPNKRV